MIDFVNIPKKDQEQLLLDLFSIIDFTKSINSGSYYKNLHVIVLNIMGELAATKGFICVRENSRYRVMSHKGRLDTNKVEDFINDRRYENDTTSAGDSSLEEIECALVIPVKRNEIIAYIGLGGNLVNDIYEKKKDFYLKAFINIASLVIDNELLYKDQSDLNKQLEQKIYQLNTIFDISAELNMQLEESRILDITLHTIIGHFLISRAVIYTYIDKNHSDYIIKGIKDKNELITSFYNESFISYLRGNDFIDISGADLDFLKPLLDQNLYYIFPMRYKDKLIGAVLLGRKMGLYNLAQQDTDFLKTLLTQALVEILNIRLFKEYTEKTIMEREISIAKGIQERLLPKSIPELEGYSVDTHIIQCNELGGDFYNIYKMQENKYVFMVGDVSGKGIPAALIMSNIQALIQAIFQEDIDLSSGMEKINRLLFESTEQNRYATLIFLVLDIDSHNIHYINAGHNQPFLCKTDTELKYLDKGGIPIGIFPKATYETETLSLETGDTIVLYTDGITEAQNPNEVEFGQLNLEKSIKENISLSPSDIIQRIISDLEQFKIGHRQNDDLTLLIIKRTG